MCTSSIARRAPLAPCTFDECRKETLLTARARGIIAAVPCRPHPPALRRSVTSAQQPTLIAQTMTARRRQLHRARLLPGRRVLRLLALTTSPARQWARLFLRTGSPRLTCMWAREPSAWWWCGGAAACARSSQRRAHARLCRRPARPPQMAAGGHRCTTPSSQNTSQANINSSRSWRLRC